MIPEDFYKYCIDLAEKFGMKKEDESKKKNVIVRKNLNFNDGGAPFFAFINPSEAPSGPYSDFSLVFFPDGKDYHTYTMAIGVGTEGFKNDYELAKNPGLRRIFLKLLPQGEEYHSFCKPKFTDIETSIPSDLFAYKQYGKVLPIGCRINTKKEIDLALVAAWIAQYAVIRRWPTKALQKEVNKTISAANVNGVTNDDKQIIKELLKTRRFIILQGAPGTGKTYMAEDIAMEYDKVFFIQFHAETTYADFVYGIVPGLDSEKVVFSSHYGVLCQAIEYAQGHPSQKVLLIIDEINRANLANVIGPVFYLFEAGRKSSQNELTIGDRSIREIPKKLDVIATMNTADRSIAVVDFALRRRFAWYTVKPKYIPSPVGQMAKELFDKFSSIFEQYASDAELTLQPGGAYFIAEDENELKLRLEYELMPLIKEYLEQGLLVPATREFQDLFYNTIGRSLFE